MPLRCTNPDCNFDNDGKCADGFEPGECQHLKEIEEDLEPDNTDLTSQTFDIRTEPLISIHPGKSLSKEAATDVLRANTSRVIAILGPLDAGKTTFALALYRAFLQGQFNGWHFAGSRTLYDFENLSHLSRAGSGNIIPDTLRTSYVDDLTFLHLTIAKQGVGRYELLISNRSGEYYENIANSTEQTDQLHEVTRADYILFFVDGERLIDIGARHDVKNELVMLIRTLKHDKIFQKKHRVAVVLTKYDQVHNSANKAQAEGYMQGIMDKVRELCGSEITCVDEFRIASRPDKPSDIGPLYGVAELLEKCMQNGPICTQSFAPEPSSRIFLSLIP